MTEQTPADLPNVAAVYLGQRVLSDGKLGDLYILRDLLQQTDGDVSAATSAFAADRKPIPALVIGGVYMVPAKVEDGRISTMRTAGRSFVERIADPRVGDWEARHAAATTRVREAQITKRLKDDRALDREITTLRERYRRLPFGDKIAFELWLLNAIRRGR